MSDESDYWNEDQVSVGARIDQICDEFESALRDNQEPQIDEYLELWKGQYQELLFRELLLIEWQFSRAGGRSLSVEDYQHQFASRRQDVIEAYKVFLPSEQSDLTSKNSRQLRINQHIEPEFRAQDDAAEAIVTIIQIDDACEEFAKQLEREEQPKLDHFLSRADERSKPVLLKNLLRIELGHRRRKGEEPSVVDYKKTLPGFEAEVSKSFYDTLSFAAADRQAGDVSLGESSITRQSVLGDYSLTKELGRGGMGTVFAARHIKKGFTVALKVLPHVDAKSLQYFKSEFRRIAEINHPNLIGLKTLEADGGHWFFTMDIIEGSDFLSFVRPNGECDEQRLRSCLVQLASGILRLHSENIIHCDLKPSNVMVTADGRVVVLDLGLALKTDSAAHVSADRVAGTPAFMAPEQVLGEDLTGAADWYAVGVMLYTALTGVLPFSDSNGIRIMTRKTTEAPDPCSAPPGLEDLASLADLLLCRDPRNRATPMEVATRLSHRLEVVEVQSGKEESELVGREQQLHDLHQAFDHLKKSGSPEICFVSGRSGEGKTSLVDNFLHAIRAECPNAIVFAGRCYDRESVPFKALDGLVDALTDYLRSLPEADASLMIPDDIEFLAELFPVLTRVSSVNELCEGSLPDLDQQQVQTRAFTALRALFKRLAKKGPVVLFADDLQWGDRDSANALGNILLRSESPAVLFIGSYRSDESDESLFLEQWRSLATNVQVKVVNVSPLNVDQCTELAINQLDRDTEDIRRVAFEFASQTGGNPMLFCELINGYDPDADSFEAVPLSELIVRKLRRISEGAAPLLEAIAVSGQAVMLDEVELATGLAGHGDSLATALRSEKLLRLLERRDSFLVDTYHDKIRESVLDEMDDEKRRQIHSTLGSVIEQSVDCSSIEDLGRHLWNSGTLTPELAQRVFDLSYHYESAGDSKRAYVYSALAAQQASSQFSQSVAAEQFSIARRHASEASGKFQAAKGEGQALCLMGQYIRAKEALEGVLELTDDPVEQARVLGLRAQIAHKCGLIQQGIDLYAEAIRKLGHYVPRGSFTVLVALGYEAMVQAFHTLAPKRLYRSHKPPNERQKLAIELSNRKSIVSYYSNTFRMLWTHLKGFNLAERNAESVELAYSYGLHPAPVAAVGLAERGLRYSDDAIKIATSHEDRLTLGHIRSMRCLALYATGRHHQCVQERQLAFDLCERAGDMYLLFISSSQAVMSLGAIGDVDEAARIALDGFERAIACGEFAAARVFVYVLALATEGNFPYQHFSACLSISEEDNFSHAVLQIAKGLWQLRNVELDDALKTLEDAYSYACSKGVIYPYTVGALQWIATAPQMKMQLPDTDETERRRLSAKCSFYLRQARFFCLMFPVNRAPVYRELGLLNLRKGRRKKARYWLEQSLAVATKHGEKIQRARTLIALSDLDDHAIKDQKELDEANETLNQHEAALRRQFNEC